MTRPRRLRRVFLLAFVLAALAESRAGTRQIQTQTNPNVNAFWATGAAVRPSVRPTSQDGEAWVPPDVREMQISWDVTKIRVAIGVVWQASRAPFPAADPNDASTLLGFAASLTGVLRGQTGTFTVRLDEAARRVSALRASSSPAGPAWPRIHVRVIPIAPRSANRRPDTVQAIPQGRQTTPNVITVGQPSPALVVNHRAANCSEMPEACCPTRDVCAALATTLFEIRIRSYVPPRFSVMGRHDTYAAPNLGWANIVSDVDRPDVGVRKGCRFYPVAIVEQLRRNLSVWEEFTSLGEAVLKQWGDGYASAKTFVARNIATGVCEGIGNPSGCRGQVQAWAATGIDIGLASLGIPPEIPDLEQLRRHGVDYLASMAASAALGPTASAFGELPMGDALYDKVYREASQGFAREIDAALPVTRMDGSNPMTWGRIDAAYRPHPARLYLEVRVREGRSGAVARLLKARRAALTMPVVSLEDRRGVFAARKMIALPAAFPGGALILPLDLAPSLTASGSSDDANAAIPGVAISRKWLRDKFGLEGTLATAQYNYMPHVSDNYLGSDYDLFYQSTGQYEFVVSSRIGGETVIWGEKRTGRPGAVWDSATGVGVRTGAYFDRNSRIKAYHGLVEPSPRCDGQPNQAVTR